MNDFRNWAVIQIIASPQCDIHTAESFVEGVPRELDCKAVRELIDNAGLIYGDGGVRWGNRLVSPEEEWILGIEHEFSDRSSREHLYYSDLVEQSRTDRRINLRLPPNLFGLIQKTAKDNGVSMNMTIVQILESWEKNRPIELVNSRKASLEKALAAYTAAWDAAQRSSSPTAVGETTQSATLRAVDCLFQYRQSCSTYRVALDTAIMAVIPPTIQILEKTKWMF